MINKNSKIYIAGHNGMVGSAIVRVLIDKGYKNLILADRKKLDLINQKKTYDFLKKNKPKIVIIAAAKVGGIFANMKFKSDFLHENLSIQNNLIHGSFINGIKNLIFLGSSCIYPRNFLRPIKEKDLLTGPLEKTNEPYAIAKIAGIKLCESYNSQYKTNYISLMPCNLYGPNDNFHSLNSHFMPALIRKIYELKKNVMPLKLWGTGKPKREFLYVDDVAEACVYFMNKKLKKKIINIGSDKDYTIKDISQKALKILKIKRKIKFIPNKPDGVYRKKLDITLARKYGWRSKTNIKDGILKTYDWYINNL